jgi:hypothetical protein
MTSLAQSDYQPATLDFDQVADLLIETHHLIYLPEQGELYDFKDGVYVNGIEPELATLTEQHNWKAKNQFVNEVIGKIKRRVRHVKISEIEADPFVLRLHVLHESTQILVTEPVFGEKVDIRGIDALALDLPERRPRPENRRT